MERIIEKLTSGKFILTVIAGVVFAYAVVTKQLEAQATASILTAVFISYFQKNVGQNNKAPIK